MNEARQADRQADRQTGRQTGRQEILTEVLKDFHHLCASLQPHFLSERPDRHHPFD